MPPPSSSRPCLTVAPLTVSEPPSSTSRTSDSSSPSMIVFSAPAPAMVTSAPSSISSVGSVAVSKYAPAGTLIVTSPPSLSASPRRRAMCSLRVHRCFRTCSRRASRGASVVSVTAIVVAASALADGSASSAAGQPRARSQPSRSLASRRPSGKRPRRKRGPRRRSAGVEGRSTPRASEVGVGLGMSM